ncbi:MAG: L-idonate 5-dehydrogenase [Actinobacteria bacterium]|nr:L-idonate 5-dehydrogenase [Actinomycetota bacterium]
MKAVVAHGAHDLRIEDCPQLDPPGPSQVTVDLRYGGICGSDLHYFADGQVGTSRIREPLILGHELSGEVSSLGSEVHGVEVGQRVTIHPGAPCGVCSECVAGRISTCSEQRYLGSAAHLPHVDGGFRDRIIVQFPQVVPLPDGLPLSIGVLAEPLAVAMHAVRRAGEVRDRSVLVSGAGAIGCLTIVALRAAGAGEIIARDPRPVALAIAKSVGAHITELVGKEDVPREVDLAVEASGTVDGLAATLRLTKRGGRVVEVGLMPAGGSSAMANLVVTRELELVGAYRFNDEIKDAVELLDTDDLAGNVITRKVPLHRAADAFAIAADPTHAGKVLLEI